MLIFHVAYVSRRDCMFHAVVKGLREKNLVAPSTSARELRWQVGEYMLDNPDRCGAESYAATCTDADVNAGMPPTFEAYAKAMKGELSSTRTAGFYQWGGILELAAITQIYKLKCSIFQPDKKSAVQLGIYKIHGQSPESWSSDNNDHLSMYDVLDEQKLASLAVGSDMYLWRLGGHFDYLTLSPTILTRQVLATTCLQLPTISTTCSRPPPVVGGPCSRPPPVFTRPVRLSEEEKHCSFEQCPSRAHHLVPTSSFQFHHRIQAGRTAGGQDWSSLEGQILCGSCMGYFSKYGGLVRGFKGKVIRRRKTLTHQQCDYEHCPLSSSSGSYYRVVEEGRTAGGKDWSQVVGMRLCGGCLQYFSKFGALDRKGRGCQSRKGFVVRAITTVDDTELSGNDGDSFSCRDDSDFERPSSLGLPTEVIEADNDGISEQRSRCSYALCPRPDESFRFRMIEEGYGAAGTDHRNWTPYHGMVLCHACCEFIKKYGTLERGLPKDERPGQSDSQAANTLGGVGWQEDMEDRDGCIVGRSAEKKPRPSDLDPEALSSSDSDDGVVWEGRGKTYKPLPIPNVQACVKPEVENTAFNPQDATDFDIDAFTVGNADVRCIEELGYVWQLASYIPSKGISLHEKDEKWDILITVAPMQMVCRLPPRWISYPGEFVRRLCLLFSITHKYVMPDDNIDNEDHKGPHKVSRNGHTRMISGQLLQSSLQEMGIRRISLACYGMGEFVLTVCRHTDKTSLSSFLLPVTVWCRSHSEPAALLTGILVRDVASHPFISLDYRQQIKPGDKDDGMGETRTRVDISKTFRFPGSWNVGG
jgi:hypothetical protein